MIIEFVNPPNARPCIFVHFSLGTDKLDHVRNLTNTLTKSYKIYNVLMVVNGQPCPTNPLPKITIANKDNPELMDALKALVKHGVKPGEVKLLSAIQMKAITEAQANGDMQYIS